METGTCGCVSRSAPDTLPGPTRNVGCGAWGAHVYRVGVFVLFQFVCQLGISFQLRSLCVLCSSVFLHFMVFFASLLAAASKLLQHGSCRAV
jgi:hypothetical protein